VKRVLLAVATLTAACSSSVPEPNIQSSAGHGSYAVTYPAALQTAATSFSERQSKVRKVIASFDGFPRKLKDPNWSRVGEVYDRAEEVGRSHAYADRMDRVEGAHVFFETEREELVRKVAGSANYVIKKKQCDVDVGGAVSGSMKETVDKQLEKELRDASDAHLLIDRYRTQLKRENVPELEKQATAIAYASYTVHVDLVKEKLRLRRMIEEGERVKKSQEEYLAAESAAQAEKGVTDADKRESQERVKDMKQSQGRLEAALVQARDLEPKLDDQLQAIQKELADGLAALKRQVADKAGSKGQ
jgi:hypothetical protein